MDVTGTKVVVGMAARHVYVWDLRNVNTPSQKRESSLKYQTRCLRCTPDGTGVARVDFPFFNCKQSRAHRKVQTVCNTHTKQ
jgi:cell cycle arrest protein BUB3